MPLYGLPGERIAYEVYPSRAEGGPPLVLIHGFTASSVAFDTNIEPLRQHFTVITVDLLGHGQSEAPPASEPYQAEAAIQRLLGLFDQLGLERVLVAGHSLGGALALRLALEAPDRLAGLVVMNSMSAAGDPKWRKNAAAGMAEVASRARAEGTAFLKKTRLYPAHSKRLDDRSRQLLIEAFEAIPAAGIAGTAEGLIPTVNVWEDHPALAVPLLVVIGDRDREFVAIADSFAARFPAGMVRKATLSRAGHAANIEQPRAFEDAVIQFAREIGFVAAAASPGASFASRLGGPALTAVGAVLVVGGIGLLAASFLLNGSSGSKEPNLAAAAPASPTIVTAVAGTRIAGPNATGAASPVAIASAEASPTPAGSPSVAASATNVVVTATPTSRPATPTPTPTATATPSETPAPTNTPAPTPTAPPAGPHAAISGPATAAPGQTVTFIDASGPNSDILTWKWGTNGEVVPQTNPSVLLARFASSGCYSVSVTTYFRSGGQRTASLAVSVGGTACQ